MGALLYFHWTWNILRRRANAKKMNKRNLFWPVPNSAITANSEWPLAKNFGYTGYAEGQTQHM